MFAGVGFANPFLVPGDVGIRARGAAGGSVFPGAFAKDTRERGICVILFCLICIIYDDFS